MAPAMAYAYLDPGTGSMIIQMMIAGVLGAVLYVKLAWTSTKNFFSRMISSPESKARHGSDDQPAEPPADRKRDI